MNENLKAFCEGFVRGAKETPRQFFAPVIALYRWIGRLSDEVVQEQHQDHSQRIAAGHK